MHCHFHTRNLEQHSPVMRQTVALVLLCYVSNIACVRNLISEAPLFTLIDNFTHGIYNAQQRPKYDGTVHSRWEQHFETSDGHIVNISWIFHSSKSMQDRMSTSMCEIVTWTVQVDKISQGQVTCLWSMTNANHCNHVCPFPLLRSDQTTAGYLGFLRVTGDLQSRILTFVVHNSPRESTGGDNNANMNTDDEKYLSLFRAEGGPDHPLPRQLRSYSDSNEWNPLSNTKLTSSDGFTNENFGTSVSISGEFAAVGAIGSKDYQGRVFVYERQALSQWRQEYFALEGMDDYSDLFFGWSCSMSGDTVAVGAYQTMHVQENRRKSVGAVYMYLKVWYNKLNDFHYMTQQ